MKKGLQILNALILVTSLVTLNNKLIAQTVPVTDSVVMGAGYADEIYYSMANGSVLTSPRNTWDIAFRTRIMSSSILINDGKGVILYTYPKADTSGWSSVDTSGLFEWMPMYNDPDDWENGAFSRYATSGLDFGWGIYDTGTHFIKGDSLFVIQLRDGSFRKLWIQLKKSALDLYYFKYANLDGSEEHTDTLDCNPYTAKDFIGFSLTTNSVIDFQPDRSAWDILFTKYMSVQPNGEPYPVTGVLDNEGIYAEKFKHVSTSFNGYNPYEWDSTRSVIGYDWKMFDGTAYQIVDSLVSFVKDKQGGIYKIVFTGFAGSSTGMIIFEKSRMAGVGINEKIDNALNIQVYPNPVQEKMIVFFPEATSQDRILQLRDLSGRLMSGLNVAGHESAAAIDVTSLNPGIYFLQVTSKHQSVIKKIIISR